MDIVGYQGRINAPSTATTISDSLYTGLTPRGVTVQTLAQDCWVSCDGTAATATNGIKIYDGHPPVFINVHPSKLSFLEAAAGADVRYMIMTGR